MQALSGCGTVRPQPIRVKAIVSARMVLRLVAELVRVPLGPAEDRNSHEFRYDSTEMRVSLRRREAVSRQRLRLRLLLRRLSLFLRGFFFGLGDDRLGVVVERVAAAGAAEPIGLSFIHRAHRSLSARHDTFGPAGGFLSEPVPSRV